jgi:hypothetical protein
METPVQKKVSTIVRSFVPHATIGIWRAIPKERVHEHRRIPKEFYYFKMMFSIRHSPMLPVVDRGFGDPDSLCDLGLV